MKRFGKVLRLREGAESEYERMHKEVWPDVVQAIGRAGICNFTIFRYDRWLFCYFELPDQVSAEDAGRQIASNPLCVEWENLMHRLQEPLPESSGLNWWVEMKEIFHLEGRR